MEVYEAAAIVLIVMLIGTLVYKNRKHSRLWHERSKGGPHRFVKPGSSHGHSAGASEGFTPGNALASENARIAKRVGVRHDAAGNGTSRPPHPMDAGKPLGGRMTPARLSMAEQQAWTPYTPDSEPYDVRKGSKPGSDFAQQQNHDGDWAQKASDLALDPRTREQHRQWVDEVAPFSQTSFSVDNLDEAVAMSQHRHGITAFRALTPAQTTCTQQITELDADTHAAQFSKFNFNA